MAVDVAVGWQFEVERGPDWLFVRLKLPSNGEVCGRQIAEEVWDMLQNHFTRRVVLELDDVAILRSELLTQFMRLHQRVQSMGGLLRLCGVSEYNQEVLRRTRLLGRLPLYATREEAVMSHRPNKPR